MINFMKKFENLNLLIYGMTKRTNKGILKNLLIVNRNDNIVY